MLTGRKYRLALTAGQSALCEEFGNICRSVWNTALDQRRQYRQRGAWMNYVPQVAEMAEAKGEYPWLRAAPSHVLQQTLWDLDKACRDHGTFKVRWRSKGRWSPSFRFPVGDRIMGRVTDRRADFCAWTANRIAASNSVVVLEDLKTKNMTASATGTLAEPGKHVAQKRGLNRAILDKGWHRLELALTNAARYTGTIVVKVNPAYTSQTCNACKVVDSESRKSQAVFECTACGHQDHADVNAAKNILNAGGWPVSACGDLGTSRSAKQEPPGPREAVPDRLAIPLAGIPRR